MSGADKKEQPVVQKSSEPQAARRGGHTPMPDGCHAWGCKAKSASLDFCQEHYDHFKFGLIKRTGEPVPDYEKKFGHYVALQQKRRGHKVA